MIGIKLKSEKVQLGDNAPGIKLFKFRRRNNPLSYRREIRENYIRNYVALLCAVGLNIR